MKCEGLTGAILDGATGDKRPIQQQAAAVHDGTQQCDDRPFDYRIMSHACRFRSSLIPPLLSCAAPHQTHSLNMSNNQTFAACP